MIFFGIHLTSEHIFDFVNACREIFALHANENIGISDTNVKLGKYNLFFTKKDGRYIVNIN